ncbi:MAG: dihydroorotate dehydrogenase electron transfer subunit [Clostridia bacterium]|nr:dihydroorotate dehydrogenase electron transfer subunit [Clostridia bacterium]
MKRIMLAEIVGKKLLAENIYQMDLKLPSDERMLAGQFVNVYLKDREMLLPRPIVVCKCRDGILTLVFRKSGKGTGALAGYRIGKRIKVSSGLGNGYMLDDCYEGKRVLLISGGIGIPALVQLARYLHNRGAYVVAVLGYKGEVFLEDELALYCDELHICTENGKSGFKGTVLEYIKEHGIYADYAFGCGPRPMLKVVTEYCLEHDIPIQISLEERMGCGYGACIGCVCTLKINGELVKKQVCLDGPIFYGNEVVWE